MTAPHPRSLRSARQFRWLLDLNWCGQAARLSNRQTSAPDPDGTTRLYRDGLQVDQATDSVDFLAVTPQIRSVTCRIQPMPALDVPAATEAGRDPTASTAILRLWADTGGSGDVLWSIRGRVLEPSYGGPEEEIVFNIRETPAEDTARFPATTARIDTTTWPSADSNRLGIYYPWILGAPGDDAYLGATKPATPGYLVHVANGTLLIAGHHVAASFVKVRNMDDGTFANIAVTNGTDALGQEVAYVNLTASGVTITEGDEYYVSWYSGGGIPGADGSAMRGRGDLLLFFLRLTKSLAVDYERVEPLKDYLNAWKLDMHLQPGEERLRPIDVIRDHILPVLPISAAYSDVGLYYVPWRFDATDADAIATMTGAAPDARGRIPGNADVTRISPVQWTSYADVYNDFVFSYANDQSRDTYHGRLVVTGSSDRLRDDSAAEPNLYCIESDALYGTRSKDVSLQSVWDTGTIAAYAGWMIRRYWHPTRAVTYLGGPWYGYLYPGAVVAVTDAKVGFSSQVCVVEGIRMVASGDVEMSLRTLEDRPRKPLSL